ncbi:MAG TPA: 30S ribosomal protein S20 [Candidatus Dojkabacteria bacterium]|nr:30S ribosomal protein S20 [Candidatus Dojkabacteria bacterium]HQF36180.1 30S ribosomal protein S20 [Candidatus Dojkabacteria bacterium]
MANLKAAKKMVRGTKIRAKRNQIWRNRVKDVVKEVKVLSDTGKKVSPEKLSKLYKTVDKATKKNVLHPNKAARIKSRIQKKVNSNIK